MKTRCNLPQKATNPLNLFICFSLLSFALYGQTTSIPDPKFEQALIDQGIDSDGTLNGQVLTSDIENVTMLDVRYRDIVSLAGIEGFTDLEVLDVRGNSLTTLNTSSNTQLKLLTCSNNSLTTLNTSGNAQLRTLNCSVNSITFINVSDNQLLETLNVADGLLNLETIDLSNNINLETLGIGECGMDFIDLSNNINLKTLVARGISFPEIDLSNNLLLEYLDVIGAHDLNRLDVSLNTNLKELYFGNYGGTLVQPILDLDLSNNPNLEFLSAQNSVFLETLNLKNGNNSILTVDLSCEFEGEPCKLEELHCVTVDDETAATNDELPYKSWHIDADFIYSEDCTLGLPTRGQWAISLYPNPAKDKLFLSSKDQNGTLSIKIFSIQGKLLNAQSIDFKDETSIDVSQLTSGIYFLSIQDENGRTEVQKFVKE